MKLIRLVEALSFFASQLNMDIRYLFICLFIWDIYTLTEYSHKSNFSAGQRPLQNWTVNLYILYGELFVEVECDYIIKWSI